MANVTGATLNPILERLNDVDGYHPFDADTFADWSVEAGDKVSMIRGEQIYVSPINNVRMVWRGAPKTELSSTGQRERDSIASVGKKKYGSGSGGMRAQQGFNDAIFDENGYLRSVIDWSESHLRTEFQDADNAIRSVVEQTESYWRASLDDAKNDLHSEVEQTASYWRASLDDAKNDLHSEVEQTASYWRAVLDDTANSLHSEVQQTASYWRAALDDTANSLHSEVEQTASYWRAALDDTANSLHSEVEQTASYWRASLADTANSLHSEVQQTASSWEAKISGVADANGNVTAASMAVAINEAGEGVATIDADKVYIGNQKSTTVIAGKAALTDVTAENIAAKLATLSNLAVTKITTQEVEAGTLKFSPVYGMGSVNVATGYNGSSLTLSGNTYTLRLAKFNGDYDEYSFSRATTLSGAWSGRTFLVTATPQGNVKGTTIYDNLVPDTSAGVTYDADHKTVSQYFYVYEDDEGDAGTTIMRRPVSISANDAYAAGWTDGAASGGSTTLTDTWSGGKITVTASPQGATLERLLQAGAATWSGTRATIPISSVYGSSGQYSEGVVFSPFVDVSSKLQTKTGTNKITANGTYTPGSGYIGFSSVEVDVPSTNAKARFGASNGQYFIEAYDSTSGTSIQGSSENYALALSTSAGHHTSSTVAQINHSGSGSTPTLSLSTYWSEASASGYNSAKVSGSWGTGNNSNVWTVSKGSSGSNNLSMTVTAGVSAQSYNSSTHRYTAFGYAYGDGVQKASSGSSVSGTEAYDAGRAAVTLNDPTWNSASGAVTSRTVTVTTSGRTNSSGTTDNLSKSVSLYLTKDSWSSNKQTVRMRTGSTSGTTYAQVDVDASSLVTSAGYAGKAAVGISGASWSGNSSAVTNRTVSVNTTGRTDTSGAAANLTTSIGLYLTQGDWGGTNDSVRTIYLREGSASGTVRAQVTVDATSRYANGWNANKNAWIDYGALSSYQGALQEGSYIKTVTNDINGNTVNNWRGGYWFVPSAWFLYRDTAGSNHQGTLTGGRYIELVYTRPNNGTPKNSGATWYVPETSTAQRRITEVCTLASDKSTRITVKFKYSDGSKNSITTTVLSQTQWDSY